MVPQYPQEEAHWWLVILFRLALLKGHSLPIPWVVLYPEYTL
jgi:hypothetical protein